MRRVLPLLAVLALAFAPAPLPKKDRQREDPTDVNGTWEIITKGDHYREDYVMRLDPTVSPPAFTWSRGGRLTFVGSYRLKKDQLTVIFDRA